MDRNVDNQSHDQYLSGFHLEGAGRGACPPLDIFSPPLSEIVVLLFLRSNPFFAPHSKKITVSPLLGTISK